jgi:hypothetical protein
MQPGVLNYVSIGVGPMDMTEFLADTKADIQIEDKVYFAWEETDVVGMFPDKGAQAYFEMASHAGETTASFDGGGWALKSAREYAVYYPYSYDHKERTAIPMHYHGQKQVGKNNYDHLKRYQHLATGAAKPHNGACNYEMQRAEALVRFRLQMPRIAIYDELSIKVSDGTKIYTSSILDVSEEEYKVIPTLSVDQFFVSLEDVVTSVSGEFVDFYLMLPPQNLSGKKLIISVNTVKGDSCQASIDGKDMKHNTAYHYEAILTTEFGSSGEPFEGIDGSWDNNSKK